YGIALHFVNTLPGNNNKECGYLNAQNQRIVLPCENEIVAYNPQCYPTPQMACDAAERAKELINDEGLHVIEHILLRPHCIEECECKLPVCNNEFDKCKFPYWKKPSLDPCEEEKPVCFIPGQDPYSFIATIVLPAWPKRFRNEESRLQLENILYREAPAHVLLRILWLAPHDFCCFEKQYKQWLKWLAQKKQCTDFSICDLRDFLFYRQYECLSEPETCKPCGEDLKQENPCLTERVAGINTKKTEQFPDSVNEIFCWKRQHCEEYDFIPCEEKNEQEGVIEFNSIGLAAATIEKNTSDKITKPKIKEITVVSTGTSFKKEEIEADNENLQKPIVEGLSKTKFINSRFARYRKELDALVHETKGLKACTMARRFADNNAPTAVEYKKLVEGILEAQADKKNKLFTKSRVSTCVSNTTRYYLDKWAFNGKKLSELEKCKPVFDLLRKNKIIMLDIYRLWESDALLKYEPGIDMNSVRFLLTGNN
ncbi:MAG: hypothetical protein ACKVOW_04455, partial [Chitinophagaceae bacterium]